MLYIPISIICILIHIINVISFISRKFNQIIKSCCSSDTGNTVKIDWVWGDTVKYKVGPWMNHQAPEPPPKPVMANNASAHLQDPQRLLPIPHKIPILSSLKSSLTSYDISPGRSSKQVCDNRNHLYTVWL